jgi:hypothetical protein
MQKTIKLECMKSAMMQLKEKVVARRGGTNEQRIMREAMIEL